MARIADRVKETTTTTGTGDITLAGAATRFRSFGSQFAVGDDNIPYVIEAQSGSEWESGLGTYVATDTLRRDTVIESSNADALVNFSAGTKDVYVSLLSDQLDTDGRIIMQVRGGALP